MSTLRLATASARRRPALSLLAGLLVACVCAAAIGKAEAAPKNAHVGKVSVLYVLDGKSGSLQREGKSGRYKLTLKGTDRNAVWFSDRPARRSGTFPSAELAGAWRGFGFAGDPPNAALAYQDRDGERHTVVLRLTRPRYSERGEAIHFTARPIDPAAAGPHLGEHARVAERVAPGGFREPALFVDDAEAINLDGCIFQPYQECIRVEYENAFFLEGVEAKGSTWWTFELKRSNLNRAKLEGIKIYDSSLEGTQLKEANLRGGALPHVDLQEANLENADLSGANLENAFLLGANLNGANLSGANLTGAELQEANLDEADLSGAQMSGTRYLVNAGFYATTMPDGSTCSNLGAENCSTALK